MKFHKLKPKISREDFKIQISILTFKFDIPPFTDKILPFTYFVFTLILFLDKFAIQLLTNLKKSMYHEILRINA
jgi:hypothetical protein